MRDRWKVQDCFGDDSQQTNTEGKGHVWLHKEASDCMFSLSDFHGWCLLDQHPAWMTVLTVVSAPSLLFRPSTCSLRDATAVP